eukprot:jgi/Picsp_1/5392/NSC_02752-R1_protein ltv1 homolog
MVVKKRFIDKKTATTYSLVYRSAEDGAEDGENQGDERVLYDKNAKMENVSSQDLERERYGNPLSWLKEEEGVWGGGQVGTSGIDESRRQELIELGFDDDGYDYLKHLRTLGRGHARMEVLQEDRDNGDDDGGGGGGGAQEEKEGKIVVHENKKKNANKEAESVLDGASVFVKAPVSRAPEEDVAVFDASGLTVLQQVADEIEATELMGGVTAFSRKQREKPRKNQDLVDIEKMMEEAEMDGEDPEGRILGDGDLLDDFVITATGIPGQDMVDDGDQIDQLKNSLTDDSIDWKSQEGSSATDEGTHVDHKPGSIASTYWREERQDRKNLLSVIDEQFEHLAVEYDEDELGYMDDKADEINGIADVHDFNHVLDEFVRDHPKRGEGGDTNGKKKIFLQEEMELYGFGNEDADVAIRMARQAIRRAEEVEEDAHTEKQRNDDSDIILEKKREQWDCESILSLKSNLYNHPGTISEPARQKGPAPGTIRLNKHGLPADYIPKAGFTSVKPIDEAVEIEFDSSLPPVLTSRKKGESLEEKKERKAAVKAAKRQARSAKKELKMIFKQEKAKADKRDANASVQPSILM